MFLFYEENKFIIFIQPIKATKAVELNEKPGANKIEEYKKIFSSNEWIFEGKGM